MNTKEIFNPLKEILDIGDNTSCVIREIHDKFIGYICSFSNLRALTLDQVKTNQENLKKISNEIEFKNFCEKTSIGIYYKCCFWAQNSNLKLVLDGNLVILEQHHIECQYMVKYIRSESYSNLIKQKFNLVTVTKYMHIFLHLVRWLEYSYTDDFNFLSNGVVD